VGPHQQVQSGEEKKASKKARKNQKSKEKIGCAAVPCMAVMKASVTVPIEFMNVFLGLRGKAL
jgi:hypothetical protein